MNNNNPLHDLFVERQKKRMRHHDVTRRNKLLVERGLVDVQKSIDNASVFDIERLDYLRKRKDAMLLIQKRLRNK